MINTRLVFSYLNILILVLVSAKLEVSGKKNKTLVGQCVQQGSKYVGQATISGSFNHWSDCAYKCFSRFGCDGWSWDYARTVKECSIFTAVTDQIIGIVHRSFDTSLR